jgi:hypothetical protein
MAYCVQTLAGLARDCEPCQGGIREAWIANYAESAFTVTSGTVSAIQSGSAYTFYHYTFKKDTGSFTSTLNVDNANGVNYVSTEINLVFSRMETLKRAEVAALSLGDTMMVIKDANSKYWAFGVDEPVNASAGTGETGVARGDANRYSITLLDNAKSWPYEVTKEAFAGMTVVEPTNV